jgi:hypothetical protein
MARFFNENIHTCDIHIEKIIPCPIIDQYGVEVIKLVTQRKISVFEEISYIKGDIEPSVKWRINWIQGCKESFNLEELAKEVYEDILRYVEMVKKAKEELNIFLHELDLKENKEWYDRYGNDAIGRYLWRNPWLRK